MYDKTSFTISEDNTLGKENMSPLSEFMSYEVSEYTEREHYLLQITLIIHLGILILLAEML